MPTQLRESHMWCCDYCGQEGTFDQAKVHEEECRKRQRTPAAAARPTYANMPPSGPYASVPQSQHQTSPPKGRRFRLMGLGEGRHLDMADAVACQNLEVFEASQDQVAESEAAGPEGRGITLGQVGIRCFHCLPGTAYSTVYPETTTDFASCVQMLMERHLTTCSVAPVQVRQICEQSASKRQAEHEQQTQPTDQQQQQQIALMDHCRQFTASVGIVEKYPPKSGIIFRDNLYRSSPGQPDRYPAINEPLSANRGRTPSGNQFYSSNTGGTPIMADIAATPLARRSKPGAEYPLPVERREYMPPPSADRREYPPSGGERDAYLGAFQPHSSSSVRGGQYPPGPMQDRTPLVPRGRVEASDSSQVPTPRGHHGDGLYGYPVPPSPYDMPPSNFPYFQEMNGSWVCRYCTHFHPQHRDQGSIWSSSDQSPPPGDFMDQHLSICRSYNQPPPPQYYDAPPPIAPYGYGPPPGQYGGQYPPPQPPPPPQGWGPPGPPYPPHDVSYVYPPPEYPPPPDATREQRPRRAPRPPRGPPVPISEAADHEILKSIDLLMSSDKEHFGTDFAEREARGQLVLDEDKLLLTDYFYHLMRQLRLCRFSEADRKTRGGKRENIAVGYGGLQCVHCSEAANSRKFFWSNVDRLANSFAEIPGHVLKCRRCPPAVKNALVELKRRHPEQMARLPRGSQKVFFRRMWRRLHDEDPEPSSSQADTENEDSKISTKENHNDENCAPKKSPPGKPVVRTDHEESPGASSGESNFVVERSTQDAAKALADSAGPPSSPSSRILLAIAEDKEWLSDMDCFIRRNLEVFCATEEDVEIAQQDRKYPVNIGQVGIRCIHCALIKGTAAARGTAVAFPYSINGIYEAVREFQRLHLEGCTHLPESTRAKLSGFKGSASLSSVLRKYYVLAAKALGMHDTPDGIRSGGESVPLGSSAASAFSFHENLRLPKAEQGSDEAAFLPSAVTPLESRKRRTASPDDTSPSGGSSKKGRETPK